jgi:hypothetical protein
MIIGLMSLKSKLCEMHPKINGSKIIKKNHKRPEFYHYLR